jgi:hypothetical protein
MLPELKTNNNYSDYIGKEYSSGDSVLNFEETKEFLEKHNLLTYDNFIEDGEFLR